MPVEPETGDRGPDVAEHVRPSFPLRPGKVQRPLLPPETLRRDRLFEWLKARATRRVVYVVAEAGFGKTTLVADFLRRSRVRTFWYRLDEDDTDGLVFLRYLVAACQAVDPRLLQRSAALLSESAGRTDSRRNRPADAPRRDGLPWARCRRPSSWTTSTWRRTCRRLGRWSSASSPDHLRGSSLILASRRTPNLCRRGAARPRRTRRAGTRGAPVRRIGDRPALPRVVPPPARTRRPARSAGPNGRMGGLAAARRTRPSTADRPAQVRAFVQLAERRRGRPVRLPCGRSGRRAGVRSARLPHASRAARGDRPGDGGGGSRRVRTRGATAHWPRAATRAPVERGRYWSRPGGFTPSFASSCSPASRQRSGRQGSPNSIAAWLQRWNRSRGASPPAHWAAAGDADEVRRIVCAAVPTIIGTGDFAAAEELIARFPDPNPNPWYDILRARTRSAVGRYDEALELTLQTARHDLAGARRRLIPQARKRPEPAPLRSRAARCPAAYGRRSSASPIGRSRSWPRLPGPLKPSSTPPGVGVWMQARDLIVETARLSEERGHQQPRGDQPAINLADVREGSRRCRSRC